MNFAFLKKPVHANNDQTEQKIVLMRRLSSFDSFGERPLAMLAQKSCLRRLAADEAIYHQGSPAVAVYFVLEGSVGLYQTRRSGQTDRLRAVSAGNFFGDAALFSPRERLHGARTLEKSLLLALFKSDYDQLTEAHPQTAMKILTMVATKLYQDLTIFQTEFHELSQKVAHDQLLE